MDGPAVSAFLPARLDRGSYPEHVALLERDDLLGTLQGLHEEAIAGSGRLVLVHGEAGVGKSALVREWGALAASQSPVLWGACDPLSSPRPLGPLVDVAPHLDPQVDELLRSGERDGLFEAALASLEAMSPAVLVIEDLHWADMSTLDLVRFLARRLEGTHVLVVATYRDDHLQPSDPLRVMLGDIASQSVVRRVEVPLLSPAAVAELAAESGIDAAALHRETGGNAFFVTEVVAAGGGQLPGTVQDAVLARVQRLSPLGAASPRDRRGRRLAGRAGSRARAARRDDRGGRRVRVRRHAALRGTGVRVQARDRAPGGAVRHHPRPARRAALAGPRPAAVDADVAAAVRAAGRARRDGRRRAGDPGVRGRGGRRRRVPRVAPGGGVPVRPRHAVRRAARRRRPHRAAHQAGRRVPDLRRPRARDRGLGGGAGPAARGRSRPRRGRGAAGDGRVVLHDRRQQPRHRARRRGAGRARGRRPVPAAGAGHRPARHAPRAGVARTRRRCRGWTGPSRWAGRWGTTRWCPARWANKGVACWFLGQHAGRP